MHALTAAHKTLPLPTYVRVRNLRNDRSVVVRVNDRGPFVDNRIIDLSYAAARRLDMVRDGTSLVEVTAISFDAPPAAADGAPPPAARPAAAGTPEMAPQPGPLNDVYLQVGAFGDRANAVRRFRLLQDGGIAGAFVHEAAGDVPAIYRVRIGPIEGGDHYDAVVARLERLGIAESHIVTD
ncbi:MAG: septal ring lytic transglycosylase RlpA family protein [Woeseiaceae bacterium]|nr:septal ring lytic transglycosylase RlpA family protein [Woeseiaceae bacterium]